MREIAIVKVIDQERDERLNPVAKFLIIAGLVMVGLGLLWMVGERFGLGRLPGDIVVERGNFKFYFPLATSLILSVVVSLLLWLFNR